MVIWYLGNIFFMFCQPISGFNCTLKKPPDQQDMYSPVLYIYIVRGKSSGSLSLLFLGDFF